MRNFLRCVGIGGDVYKETLHYLSRLSYRKKVVALTQMIQHLISQSLVDPSTVEPSAVLFTPQNPDIARNIVQFLIQIRTSLHLVEDPLLDAVLLNILPYVQTSWEPASIFEDVYRRMYPPFRRRRKSLPSYRTHTFELLNSIRSSGLSAVVHEANCTEDWVYFLRPLFLDTHFYTRI